MSTITIRLDDALDAELARLAQERQRSKSDLAREFIRRQLALAAFARARGQLQPLAEKAGYSTDEDFFRDFS